MKKYRRAIFAVVYYFDKGKIKYLLLKRKLHWKGWEFPKGGIENNETKRDAVKREVLEETGLKIIRIKKFDFHGKYDYEKPLNDRKGVSGQTYDLFLVEVKKGDVSIDKKEHEDFSWESYEDALKKLKWLDQKTSLKIVNDYLTKQKNKFRFFITKSSKLIYLGRNSKNNEELVNQAKDQEFLLHTKLPGSPFVNIKGIANDEDIRYAAVICARYSHDWRDNKKDVLVNVFKKKDVYKNESMSAGTFGIKKFKTIKIKKKEIQDFEKTRKVFNKV